MSELKLPKENLLRGAVSGVALRADGADGEGAGQIMAGHFAVFDQWTEINSWEGNFLERIAPGAFKKTLRENRDRMQVLFQHGYDFVVGDKPLGTIRELREDDEGAYYEVELLDAPYVRDEIVPGLEAGLYGASFRFRVIREEVVEEPEPSEHNPHGLPERTIKEAAVSEFGPVTFPAYPGASAGLRSLEVDELVAAAALARMQRRDGEQARALALRFAERDAASTKPEPTTTKLTDGAVTTAKLEDGAAPADAGTDTTSPEVTEAEGTDAPPPDGAEPEQAHSDRSGRRASETPLFGVSPRTPSWRL